MHREQGLRMSTRAAVLLHRPAARAYRLADRSKRQRSKRTKLPGRKQYCVCLDGRNARQRQPEGATVDGKQEHHEWTLAQTGNECSVATTNIRGWNRPRGVRAVAGNESLLETGRLPTGPGSRPPCKPAPDASTCLDAASVNHGLWLDPVLRSTPDARRARRAGAVSG